MCTCLFTVISEGFLRVNLLMFFSPFQVCKASSFFDGLYTSQELDAKSIQVTIYMYFNKPKISALYGLEKRPFFVAVRKKKPD